MSGVARRLLAREREEETLLQAAYLVHGDGSALQVSVSMPCAEPRVTVTFGESGGFVPLPDIRRLARALASGAASTTLALRPGGALPGGEVTVVQDGDHVVLDAAPLDGPPTRYGPVPVAALATVCRDVVGWNRLLAASAR